MSHFFGKILTVWGQLLSQYNSPGIKDQPQTGRLLPPTRGPCLWRHREGPRTASLWGVGGGIWIGFFFFLDPSSSPGSGQPRKFCGLWAGLKWQTQDFKPLHFPGFLHQISRSNGLFTNDGQGRFRMPPGLGAESCLPEGGAEEGAGQQRPALAGSLPPGPGAGWGRVGWGDTTHSARSKPSEGIRCDGIPTPRPAGGGLRQHVRYLQSHSCGPAGSCG